MIFLFQLSPATLVWKTKVPLKVHVFGGSIAHLKVTIYASFPPNVHFFLHCPFALEFWHKIVSVAEGKLGNPVELYVYI